MGETDSGSTPIVGRPLFIFSAEYEPPSHLADIHEITFAAMKNQWPNEIFTEIKKLVIKRLQTSDVQVFMSEMGLDYNEAGAITYYTSDFRDSNGNHSLYLFLNRTLVDRKIHDDWKPYLYYLLRAVYKLPNLEKTVYRAFDKPLTTLSKQYVDGNTIVWVAFTSTSTKKEILKNFHKSVDYGTYMMLKVNQGKDISPLSLYPQEQEVLLLPNSTFKVVQVVKDDTKEFLGHPINMDIITLDQIASNDCLMALPNPFTSVFDGNLGDLQKWYKYQSGATLSIVDKLHNDSPLLYTAASRGHVHIVQWLIENGVDVNVVQGGSGSSPLHGAGYYGKVEVCDLLLKSGINVKIENKWKKTALDEVNAVILIKEEQKQDNTQWKQISSLMMKYL